MVFSARLQMARQNFFSIYSHGFIRAAVCIPSVKVAAPQFNVSSTLELAKQASAQQAAVALFPELGLSAYSNDDLFHQDVLLDAAIDALAAVVDASRELTPLLLVGVPLRVGSGALFNCAVVIYPAWP
jgi:NAD+ synthase (glutamine-hydrolysing)